MPLSWQSASFGKIKYNENITLESSLNISKLISEIPI